MVSKIRTDKVEKFKKPRFDPDDPDTPPDWNALLALLFGIFGFFMKYKIASWLAILFSCMSYTKSGTRSFDFKQQLMSFMFALSGLVMNYFGPNAYEAVEV